MSRILTVDQVRKCVLVVYYEGYNDGYLNRGCHYEETDWQAITDELNSRAERACSWEPFYSWLWKCSNCGETYHMKDAQKYKHCPNCGCKVVGE